MSYVFDASAIAKLLRTRLGKAIHILAGNTTLDLAYYELGNIIWKEHTLEKTIGMGEALEKTRMLAAILAEMRVETVMGELVETLRLAATHRLTFYDAAYLEKAKSRGLTLVTEDRELLGKAAKAGVRATTTENLAA